MPVTPEENERAMREQHADATAVKRRYAVTVKGWGHTSTRLVDADSPASAERQVLDQLGVSVHSELSGRQDIDADD